MSGALFDEDEDEINYVPSNYLVVPPTCARPEDLNELETQYRRRGLPPVLFVSEAGELENAEQVARAMGLPAGTVPTLEQAEAFVIARLSR